MSTAEVPQIEDERARSAGEFSASEAVNTLNLIRDEDWRWGAASQYLPDLGLRRIGEDMIAMRLRRAGSTVLIVGDWDGGEDFIAGVRRRRRAKFKLPRQYFISANADANRQLLADLQDIQTIRQGDFLKQQEALEETRRLALEEALSPKYPRLDKSGTLDL